MTEQGLKSIYLAQRTLIARLVSARTCDAQEAEDVMQELWVKLDQLRPGPVANPRSYLMRMALNLAADRALSRRRQIDRETAWTALQPGSSEYPDQEASTLASEELSRVEQAIRAMPASMGQALVMYRLEGQPQARIASALGMSLSGVEKALARAYRQLAELRGNDPDFQHDSQMGSDPRSKSDVA